jgi:hypothetical protein
VRNALQQSPHHLEQAAQAALPADLGALSRNSANPDSPLECCQSPSSGKLDVHAVNQGSVPSPASMTHVDFANSGGVDMPTPALAAGGSAIVEFTIPTTGYVSNKCNFTIVVDSTNAVAESRRDQQLRCGTM